uniref:Uncharacterized protein n=1 Tax=Arundo donax TaxID=35708 RepID=A0A0A9D3Y8_ARUDO
MLEVVVVEHENARMVAVVVEEEQNVAFVVVVAEKEHLNVSMWVKVGVGAGVEHLNSVLVVVVVAAAAVAKRLHCCLTLEEVVEVEHFRLHLNSGVGLGEEGVEVGLGQKSVLVLQKT